LQDEFQPGVKIRSTHRAEIFLQLHGEFQPGRNTLKTGWEMFVGKHFTFTTQAVRMPKFIFQPGLKFECDYMRFLSPFDRAEISSPLSQTGLSFSLG